MSLARQTFARSHPPGAVAVWRGDLPGVRPARILRALVGGFVVLTVLVLAFPTLRTAWLTARLVAEDPPASLPVPVEGVDRDALFDSWEDPRPGGRVHQGIDIFAARRTPVLTATRGVIARRGENRLGGRTVTVLGPGGQRHYYAHLDAYGPPRTGDWVETGDVIGFVGTSGNAAGTRPHLHYGIYGASGPVNPYVPLTAEPDSSAATAEPGVDSTAS